MGAYFPHHHRVNWTGDKRERAQAGAHQSNSPSQAKKLAPLVPFLFVLSSRNSFVHGFPLGLGTPPHPLFTIALVLLPNGSLQVLAGLLPCLGLKNPPAASALRRPRWHLTVLCLETG